MLSTHSQDQYQAEYEPSYANTDTYEDISVGEYDSMDTDALDDTFDEYDHLEFNDEGEPDFGVQSYSEDDSMSSSASTPINEPIQTPNPTQEAAQNTNITTTTKPQTVTGTIAAPQTTSTTTNPQTTVITINTAASQSSKTAAPQTTGTSTTANPQTTITTINTAAFQANTIAEFLTTTNMQPHPEAQLYTGDFFINLRHAAAEQQSFPASAAEEWNRRFHSMRPDPPPPPPPIRIYQVQYRTTPPPDPPSHMPVASQTISQTATAINTPLPSPQSQSESQAPPSQAPVPSEIHIDSTFHTLADAKSRCDDLWKELYLARYPGPAPEDVNQELTFAGWYEWVQVGNVDRVSVWGKQFRFVGGLRIEMWVREEVVR